MNLTLFFTRGVSLQTWAQNGSFEREVMLYKKLQEKGINISFVTYGNKEDLQYKELIPEIKILCNYLNLPTRLYEALIPFLHFNSLIQSNVIKTNQIKGAEIALRVAKLFHKFLIVRCGYIWSDFARQSNHQKDLQTAIKIESEVFLQANQVIVTTQSMKDYIVKNYGINHEKIVVIPNYVLTDIFAPQNTARNDKQILSIGRLVEQKNFFSLVKACKNLPVELVIVGHGPLHASLLEAARNTGVSLTIYANMPHSQIPKLICQSAIFALISHYEGHPKALLEAMSCGAAVLASDVSGIKEEIIHGENGWLCNPDVKSTREGILYLLSHPHLRQTLGANARQTIQKKYSIEKVVEIELSVLQRFIRRN